MNDFLIDPPGERFVAAALPIIQSPAAAALLKIADPATDLVIWERELGNRVQADIDAIVLDEVDDIDFASDLAEIGRALAARLAEAGYPSLPAFEADLVDLAGKHAAVADTARVKMRLEVIETDACRKFHADNVTFRTIVTYRGQGTQWALADYVNDATLHETGCIHQVSTGA